MALAAVVSVALAAASARPGMQAGGDPLQLLPDGKMVILVDVQKMISSSLWTDSSQNPIKAAFDKAQSEISELGLNLADIRTAAIVFPAARFNDPTVLVTGAFNQSDLIARLRSMTKVKLTSEKYKDAEIFRVEDAAAKPGKNNQNGGAFVFHDASTVVAGSQAAVRASVDARAGARPNLAQNATMTAAVAQDPTAAIRFAVEMNPATAGSIQSSQVPLPDFSSVNLIFGTINFTTSVDLNATLRNNSPEGAKTIAERLNGLLNMAKAYYGSLSDPKNAPIGDALKTVTITEDVADVRITGALPLQIFGQVIR
jgi:hypothetical protein